MLKNQYIPANLFYQERMWISFLRKIAVIKIEVEENAETRQ